jgi:ATP/maltotriose-dependent transcriptional regulator MalT
MAVESRSATTLLVSELWSQVRALADSREVDLDLRLLGKPADVSPDARDILGSTINAVIESAAEAQELHHLALEVSYQASALNVRIEHDGTLAPGTRSSTEEQVLACYGDIGALGGSLSLSSGRGFGVRLELSMPYEPAQGGGIQAPANRYVDPPRAPSFSTLPTSIAALPERLTPQEEISLSLLASGLSNKEIAARMNLGVGTVKFHLAQIYQKLGVQGRGRGAAVARARELGLLFD